MGLTSDKQIKDIEYLEIVMASDFSDFSKNIHYLTDASTILDNLSDTYLNDRYAEALKYLSTIESAIKAFREGNIQNWERP